jgi:hypothetical protein
VNEREKKENKRERERVGAEHEDGGQDSLCSVEFG